MGMNTYDLVDVGNLVNGMNALNKFVNEISPPFFELCRPLIGCRIIKVDGGLYKTHKVAFDALLKNISRPECSHLLLHVNDYNIHLAVSLNGYYHLLYIANLQNGVLESLYDNKQLKTDYDADAIYLQIQRVKNLEAELTIAKRELPHWL